MSGICPAHFELDALITCYQNEPFAPTEVHPLDIQPKGAIMQVIYGAAY